MFPLRKPDWIYLQSQRNQVTGVKTSLLFRRKRRALCISQRQSPGGEIARVLCCGSYSGGEVGVCQSPRWYTGMESDSCQEGSGLPCPLHRKSRGKRSAWRQAASVYCLVALPLYRTETHWPRLTTENISASSHGTLFQWGANGRENGGTFFFNPK